MKTQDHPTAWNRSSGSTAQFGFLFLLGWLVLTAIPAEAQFSEKVIENGKASTVRILALHAKLEDSSSGSGFFISGQGHIATNHHVVDGAEKFLVIFASGSHVYGSPATLVAISPERDLAILQTRQFPGSVVASLAVGDPTSGQKVMAIGFPGLLDAEVELGSELTKIKDGEFTGDKAAISDFIPSTFSGEVGKMIRMNFVAHSAKISEGNSGGPLIDVEGRIVGVNTAGLANKLGTDYSIAVLASHLAELARANGVPITALSSKVSVTGGGSSIPILLIITVAGLSVITFLMVLRKPRMVLAEGISRLAGSHHHRKAPQPIDQGRANPVLPIREARPLPRASGNRMVLRGKDQEGRSFYVEFNSEMFRKSGPRLYLGRNQDLCQLVVPQDSVSRQHAALVLRDDRVWVEDRNSGNGTMVNGRAISLGDPPIALNAGDRLTLGEVELIFDLLS